jgi:3-hydroxyisobutyrate dehydrogenase
MTSTRSNIATPTVAVIGAGVMGAPMARNLARKGFPVKAWNRTRSKADGLADDGVALADTPADAVDGADVILTMLNDGDSVLAAMRSAASHFKSGAAWTQMSTVGVAEVGPLAAFAGEHGLLFYDAPVQGSRQPAENGQLVILASGPDEGRTLVQPVYDAIGKRTLWVGDHAERGESTRLKLALNHYVFTLTNGVAESLRLASTLGANPNHVIDVVSGGPMDSGYFQAKSAAMLGDDFSPSFNIINALKDAELIKSAAREAGVQADLADANARRFQRANDAGHGDKDMAASYLAG